jgi:small multidrug resistance pump
MRERSSVPWLLLGAGIVAELFGTLGLRRIAQGPTVPAVALIALAYAISFTCVGAALRHLNVGVVYAIWSAIGIAAISIAGLLFFDERLSVQAVVGLVVIVVGVVVLVSSGSVRHG